MRFLNFVSEAADTTKLTHLEHLEDSILNSGMDGAHYIISSLTQIYHTLEGHSKTPLKIQRKADGAPSLVFGLDPTTRKFFVATKSAFNKNPKLNYTIEDIRINHEGGLATKLIACLKYLPELNAKGVYQGDVLFTPEDFKETTMNGETYITFRPNTITYAVKADSNIGRQIKASKIGIALHTHYEGPDIKTMVAKAGIPEKLQSTKNVFVQINDITDLSGTVTFTASESAEIKKIIVQLATDMKKLNREFIDRAHHIGLFDLMKIYNNAQIREGKLPNSSTYFKGFAEWYKSKKAAEMEKYKTPDRKEKIKEQITTVIDFINRNIQQLTEVINFYNLTTEAKMLFVKKLSAIKHSMETFIERDGNFEVTKPEGFVAIDNTGSMIKLVDRLDFSKNNFTIAKNWGK